MLKDRKYQIILIIISCCVTMAIWEATLIPSYAIKSIVKILLFLLPVCIFACCVKDLQLLSLLTVQKKGLPFAFSMALAVFCLIILSYYIFGKFFDLSSITQNLESNMGVTKKNFLYVSIYISFVNSFLEEFFFRGFAFFTLKRFSGRKFAYVFSSLAFSLYHIVMIMHWFNIYLFVLCLIVLFSGGIIFNYFNEKYENIYMSWLVHMFANFAINIIGFILFSLA